MAQAIQEACDAYKHADVSDRLHLFLKFPELRKPFLIIDQEEMAADRIASERRRGRGFNAVMRIFMRAALLVSDAKMARSVDCKHVTPIFR